MAGEAIWGWVILAGIAVGGYSLYQEHQETQTGTIEQQKFCSDAASKYAKDEGINSVSDGSFMDHFSVRYDRCFAELKFTGTTMIKLLMRTVEDPAERIEWARYAFDYSSKPYGALVDCKVRLPGGDWKQCKNLEEWNKMVQPLVGSNILN